MKRKGFTLTELVVVIAVSGILLTALVTTVTYMVSFTNAKNEKTDIAAELVVVENEIRDWFGENDTAGVTDFTYPNGETDEDLTETYEFLEDMAEMKYVKGLEITHNTSLIRCEINYGDNENYVFVLHK